MIQSFRAGRDLAQLQQLETERFDLAEHAEYCRSSVSPREENATLGRVDQPRLLTEPQGRG